jgi:hypothetical protein
MPNNTLNVALANGEEVVFHRRARRTDLKMPFLMLGNGLTNQHGTSVDLIGKMCELHTAPRKLLVRMIQQRDVHTNLVTHQALMALPDVNKRTLDNHMPALIKLDLVRRVQRGVYMINPLAVLPPNGIDARAQWLQLCSSDGSILESQSSQAEAPTPVEEVGATVVAD